MQPKSLRASLMVLILAAAILVAGIVVPLACLKPTGVNPAPEPQKPAAPAAMTPDVAALLEERLVQAPDAVGIGATPDPDRLLLVLSEAEVARLARERTAVEDRLMAALAPNSEGYYAKYGAAYLLADLKCHRALPVLRQALLKDRYFYGWEGPDYGTAEAYADDTQYSHHLAYIAAIERISGKPIAEAVALTDEERRALEAEAARAKPTTEDTAPWVAKWLLAKLAPAAAGFVVERPDGRRYRITPDPTKLGRDMIGREDFQRRVRDALRENPKANVADVVFYRLNARGVAGGPPPGPPIKHVIKDFATVTELPAEEKAAPALDPAVGKAAEPPWGEEVGGVQVRLRAEKTQWKADETPTLMLDVANRTQGMGVLVLYLAGAASRVEIDGWWYSWTEPTEITPSTPPRVWLSKGSQTSKALEIPLSDKWGPHMERDKADLQGRLQPNSPGLHLAPGIHKVRVSFCPDTAYGYREPPSAVSNAVEIEILPAAAEVPVGKPAEAKPPANR